MRLRAVLVAALCLSGLATVSSEADGPASGSAPPSGEEIARRINARDEGTALEQKIEMALIDKQGRRREREMIAYRKYFGEEKRTVIFFEEPKNIEGTAFLTYDYPEPGRDDDLWLYLPALRKSRRIAAADRGASFVGTDFSYDDIKKGGKVSLEDYRWTTIAEQEVDGRRCYTVEALPVDDETARELGYGRVVLQVDPEIWMVRRAEYWEPSLEPLKTIETREIREVDGIWTAHRIEARNHRTGHTTVLEISDVEYDDSLSEDLFTEAALKRGP